VGYDDCCRHLHGLVPADRLSAGIRTLEHLHARFRELVSGRLCVALDDVWDKGYGSWHMYYLPPAVEAIAHDGWVERHLYDIGLLANSPALPDCCRGTVIDLFGTEAFHVTVQANSRSDEFVRIVCHHPGDRFELVRRIAGQTTHYSVAYGSYSPPGMDTPRGCRRYTATHARVFDAIPYR
jgi:hypothetical protein